MIMRLGQPLCVQIKPEIGLGLERGFFMNLQRKSAKGLSLKAGTALLAASVVGTGIPVTPFVLSAQAEDEGAVSEEVALVLEGDDNGVTFDTSRSVRDLLVEFAELAMPDNVSVAENCGVYLRFDEADAPKVYNRQIMRIGTLDGDVDNAVTANDFIRDVFTYQQMSSDGWIQMAFTQREDGTGGVMSNTIFKVRYVDRSGENKQSYLEFNAVDVSPAKQVTISYNFNGGRNSDTGGTSYRGYRYSDEYFDYPDLSKTMEHDTKFFTGWYTTKAAADSGDLNHQVDLRSRFTENTTLYAGWTSVEPPEFYDIVYNMPGGNVEHYTGKHPGKYVTKNADGTFSAEKNINLSKYIDSETEYLLGYYETLTGSKKFKEDDEIPRGAQVFVRKTHKTKLNFLGTDGKLIGSMDFALNYRLSEFNDEMPSFAQGKVFRLTNGKTLSLKSVISERDFSATDTEYEVSCFEVAPAKAQFTVTYDANGGTLSGSTSKTVEDGAMMGALPKPSQDKKVFEGWYTAADGGTKVDASTVVTGNMTIYAHWSDAKGIVTFDPNGGSVRGVSTKSVAYGSKLGELPDAIRDEYVFQGWYTARTGGDAVTADTTFTDDMTVYAHWTLASDPKTVSFNPNGGEVDGSTQIKTVVVENGNAIGTLPNATRSGYDFQGWYTAAEGGTRITDSTLVTADMTLYAHWTVHQASHGITSLTLNKTNIEVDYGEELGLTYSYAPANADNAIFYWTSSNEDVIRVSGTDTFQYVGSGTTTLTVHTLDGSKSASCTVKVNPVKQLVTSLRFDYPEQTVVKGGENNVNLGYTYGPVGADNATFRFTSSDPDIIRVDENGDSWAYGNKYGTVVITIGTVDGTMSATCTITVKEKDTTDPTPPDKVYYTLSYDTAGGNSIASERVESGSSVNLPTPTRSGYDFLGWFLDDGTQVTEVTVNGNLTVHARWESNVPIPDMVTVRYDAQNGNPATSAQFERGSSLGVLPTVSRDGYRFLGWFTQSAGGTKVSASTKVTADMTVYAQWESVAVLQYTLRLVPNHGFINGSSDTIDLGSVLTDNTSDCDNLATYVPNRPGYTFTGWFDNAVGGHLVYDAGGRAVDGRYWLAGKYIGKQDLQLYAQWARNVETYKLKFDVRGGDALEDITYDIGSVVTVFPTPTKEGCEFLGWFDAPTGGQLVTSVTMNTDVRLYAQWKDLSDPNPEEADKQAAKDVDTLIGEIGEVAFTSECKAKLTAARNAYDRLSDSAKAFVTKLAELEAAETAYDKLASEDPNWPAEDAELQVDYVNDLISSLPSPVRLTDTCKAAIDKARNAYNRLTDDQKKQVVNYSRLLDSENDYASLVEAAMKAAKKVDALIQKIGTVELSDACKAKIDAAREAYDKLSDAEKVFVEYVQDLSRAEAEYQKLLDDQKGQFVLTLDPQGGDSGGRFEKPAGTVIDSKNLPKPEREGYEFVGWYTAPEGGNYVTYFTLDSDVTLYAHWSKKDVHPSEEKFTVSLMPNLGALIPPHSVSLVKGNTYTFEDLSYDGYEFLGWFTEAEGGERVTSYSGPDDATFWGHWKKLDDNEPDVPVNPGELQKLFWMKRLEDGSTQPVDAIAVTTKDVSELNNLLYGWAPKDAASADDFVISSSDTSVLAITNGNWVKVLKSGKADLIVTYKADRTKTAVCHVKVNPAEGEDNPDEWNDPDWPEEADAQVKYVESLIAAIPRPVKLTNVCKTAITKARKGYDHLTEDQQKQVDARYVKILTDAEAEYKRLEAESQTPIDPEDQKAADAVKELITSIGKVTLDETCKGKIEQAREAYEDLTEDQKKLVDNLDVLEKAESDYKDLEDGKTPEDPDDSDKKEVQKVYWMDRNDPDRKEVTEITIDKNDITNLTNTIYTWTPGDAAKSGDFVIISSNEDVIRMKTESIAEILKAGETDLTVTYKKDPTKKATLHVTVTDKNGTGDNKPGDPNAPSTPIDPSNPNPDNPNAPNQPGDTNQPGADNPDDSDGTTPNKTGPYMFRMVFTDGTERNIKVQDPSSSTIRNMLDTLSQLFSKMTNVTRVTVKTAMQQEYSVDMNVPLTYLTELADAGDVLVIGYDSSGQPVGCARITKTEDKAYTVKFSKDTNVDLTKKDASDGSGVSDKSKVANEGKSDTAANPVKTADSAVVPVFGGIAAGLVAMLSGLAFWKRKKH